MRYALHDNSVSSSAKQQRDPISIAFEVSMTSEHLTPHFCDHSSIISSHLVFKMFTILDLNWNEWLGDGKENENLSSSTARVIHTTATQVISRERQQSAQK